MPQEPPLATLAYHPPVVDRTARTERAVAAAALAVGLFKTTGLITFLLILRPSAWLYTASARRLWLTTGETVVAVLLVVGGVALLRGHPRGAATLRVALLAWGVLLAAEGVMNFLQFGGFAGMPLRMVPVRVLNAAAAGLQPLVVPVLMWWLVKPVGATQ